MATRWFRKQDGREVGPSSFQELVAMLRTGQLHEDDRLRMEHGSQWTAVWKVPGLLQAAGIEATSTDGQPLGEEDCSRIDAAGVQEDAAAGRPKPPPPVGASQEAAAVALFRARSARLKLPRIPRGAMYGLLGFFAFATLIWAVSALRARADANRRRAKLDAVRAPRPESPSVEQLRENRPQLVPGLADVAFIVSPCLTGDMRGIVFAASQELRSVRHLYWAERQEINGPFGKPKPIESCSFPEGEAYPTITPDGLEMFFMRYGEEPRFYYCARTSTSADFGTPAPWSIPPGAAWARGNGGSKRLSSSIRSACCFPRPPRGPFPGSTFSPSERIGRALSDRCGSFPYTRPGRNGTFRMPAFCGATMGTIADCFSPRAARKIGRLPRGFRSPIRV